MKTGEKRTKKIDARFTEDEYQVVLEMEKTLGIRKTDLVRNGLLKNSRSVIINAKELIGQLEKAGAEIGRSGVCYGDVDHPVPGQIDHRVS